VKSFGEYVDSLSWARGQLDDSSYKTFLRAASMGVAPDEAVSIVSQRIREAGDYPRGPKLKTQIERAYEYARARVIPFVATMPRPAKRCLDVDRSRVRKVTRNVPEITPKWLRSHSPRFVMVSTPAEFLTTCFNMGERVVILTDPRSDGFLWEHFSMEPSYKALDKLRYGHKGVWYMIQPVDGKEHFNPRQERDSRRSEESVTSWRYAILESDKVAPGDWLKIVVQLPLAIQAIYSSGGASVHALIRVDAKSKADWDQLIRGKWLPLLAPLGADPGAMTAVRLSRLPSCHRGETGKIQELYYLNPEPEARPLLS
jgi:hypothetical protein